MKVALTTAALGLLFGSTQAYKDDSYYIAGTGNPNVNEGMYWKDAENVFQDLGAFQELYVEYHNCAWTWMQTTDEDNDIDENDYWYMGKIPPSGANVAFSLYGSLSGTSFSGCSERTFINSFYTNTGFTDFTKAMNYAGVNGFSSSYSYSTSCSGGYGVGCDWDNGFAVHTYSSNECNPKNYKGVKDTMSSLNSALKNAKCVKIYDKSNYGGSPYGTPLQLLAYSHSCFYQDFFSPDGVCPDPYGKLAYYQQNFYKGIQNSKKQDPYQVAQRKVLYEEQIENGEQKSMIGMGLAALAALMFFYDFVWWLCARCCCPKRKLKQAKKKQPPKQAAPPGIPSRSDDFILSTRGSQDDTADEDSTNPEYAPMQDGPISDINDIEAPPATYTPPETDHTLLSSSLPGKEKIVDVADQAASVTTYAPPALAQTDDVLETPAGKDTNVIMNPTMSGESPEEAQTEDSAVESFFATMSSTLAAMDSLVAAKDALAAAMSIDSTDDTKDEEAAKATDDAADDTVDDNEEDEPAVVIPPALSREEDAAKANEDEATEDVEDTPIKDEEAPVQDEATKPSTESEPEVKADEDAKEKESVTTTEEAEIAEAASNDAARICDSVVIEEPAAEVEPLFSKTTSTDEIAAPSMDEGAVLAELPAGGDSATDASPSEDEARLSPVEDEASPKEEEPSKNEVVATEQTVASPGTEKPTAEEPIAEAPAVEKPTVEEPAVEKPTPAADETEVSAAASKDEAATMEATPPEEAVSTEPSSSVPEAETSVEEPSPQVEESDEIPGIDEIALSRDYDSNSDADEAPAQQAEPVVANQRDEPESDDPLDEIEQARRDEEDNTEELPALPSSDSGSWFGWS